MTKGSGTALADLVGGMAATSHQPVPPAEQLDAIVRAGQESVPGVEHPGLPLTHAHGVIEVGAATAAVVGRTDRTWCALAEGPCVDAARGRAGPSS